MPFFFVLLGLLLIIVSLRNTHVDMFDLLSSEFRGNVSFLPWASSILILGLVGYVKPVRPIADAMIVLILLTIVLADKGGFFTKFNDALKNPVDPSASANSTNAGDNVSTNASAGSAPPLK